jgi:hypothetical protein
MSFRSISAVFVASIISVAFAPQANGAIIVANTVIDYFDSGAGPMVGPYGGTFPGAFPVPVPLSHATDGNPTTFVSLPQNSFLTLGFTGGFVFDGPGLDLFVSEVGENDELADIFISSDFGVTFTFLGQATTATVSGFDLGAIGYTDNVNAVKIVGLDNFGGSPGFDIAFVQGLEGSVVRVPEPAILALVSLALLGMGGASRLRKTDAT